MNFFESKGITVIHEKTKKGIILRKAISKTNCENIIVVGIDEEDDFEDIDSLLISLQNGADLVIASRFMPGGSRDSSRILSYRSIGNRFFSFLISIILNKNVTDCNNLFRGFKRNIFQKLELKEKGESIMFEMTFSALQNNLIVEEIPTSEKRGIISRKKRNRLLSLVAFNWLILKSIIKIR